VTAIVATIRTLTFDIGPKIMPYVNAMVSTAKITPPMTRPNGYAGLAMYHVMPIASCTEPTRSPYH
jgi:hypothetical protein